jgi:flagellar hook assembly protein FlgD
VTLTVYDLAGRPVRELLSGEPQPAGSRSVVWDARDDSGNRVASGVYFYRLAAGGRTLERKMVLLK